MTRLSAPILISGVICPLPLESTTQRFDVADRLLALSGPSLAYEPGHLPVRGDLAHIKLAGRCFVPHYAVPMLHRARASAVLLAQGRADAEVIAELEEGTVIEVLDIAGAWTWGQIENDGLVGYVALDAVEPLA
jgi:Bacterial dipeptidyl-peptidase Sh3 domain